MDDYSVIVRPIVTEQGMHFANVKGAYAFEVNRKANKAEIKNAIEKIYGVKVDKVRTANHKGKRRRRGRVIGTTLGLEEGGGVPGSPINHIDLF